MNEVAFPLLNLEIKLNKIAFDIFRNRYTLVCNFDSISYSVGSNSM